MFSPGAARAAFSPRAAQLEIVHRSNYLSSIFCIEFLIKYIITSRVVPDLCYKKTAARTCFERCAHVFSSLHVQLWMPTQG